MKTHVRQSLPLNEGWLYTPKFEAPLLEATADRSQMEAVRLPHTVSHTPLAYFSESTYEKEALYFTEIELPQLWQEGLVKLHFEGAAHRATVYVNGIEAGQHVGGYTAFDIEMTHLARFGAKNHIAVVLDSRESQNFPPFGHVIDYMTYGGLYREVQLTYVPHAHIEGVYVYGQKLLSSVQEVVYHIEVSPEAKALVESGKAQLELELVPLNSGKGYEAVTLVVEPGVLKGTAVLKEQKLNLWSLDSPAQYRVEARLLSCPAALGETTIYDCHSHVTGFREAVFQADGFYLNGKRIGLVGLNRHQSYPYVGYAMPKRVQALDAHILKHELGVNAVRTAHYPQSQHFIDACNELGLLVFTEIPGWQHIGNEEWQAHAQHMVKEMVTQYRHHPSIVLWGVRINESLDHHQFYGHTNRIARELDGNRQTGGVRYLKNSELLEDVYTYNDFSYNGIHGLLPESKQRAIETKKSVVGKQATKTPGVPYLVSEFNGHMYPTKSGDGPERRLEHALRHAHVLSQIALDEGVAGGFGWCFTDYNTHKDFGSGDRICHHGVMDMFRNPKLAAAVYASQRPGSPHLTGQDAQGQGFLAISSEMNIGDYPAGSIGPVYAFTNADQVKLYKNNTFIKSFETKAPGFRGLGHSPIMIDDFIGDRMATEEKMPPAKAERVKALLMAGAKYGATNLPLKYKLSALRLITLDGFKLSDGMRLYSRYVGNWGDAVTTYRFDALINDKVVASVHKGPSTDLALRVVTDTQTLTEAMTYDVATIRIQSVDQNGNLLHYDNEVVFLEVGGALELIGPRAVSLRGGMAGTYVKTKKQGQNDGAVAPGWLSIQRQGSAAVMLTFNIHYKQTGEI